MSQKKNKMNVDQLLKLEQQKSIDRFLTWIIVFILVIVPVVTRAKVFLFVSPLIGDPILSSGMKSDVFTYYKFSWLLFFVGILLLVFLYKMLAKGYKIHSSYSNAPILLLSLFVLLSGIFAEYKSIALFGQYNRHDGTITYLCYFALFFISANIIYNNKGIHSILKALYVFLIINVFLGLTYFYGYNLLQENAFFRGIFVPNGGLLNSSAYISSTINNPNYVSGIASVFVALFFTKALLSRETKRKIIDLSLSALAFAMLLSSLSTSGFITLVILLPLFFIIVWRSESRKSAFLTAGSGILCFAIILGVMNMHNPDVWKESVGFFIKPPKDNAIQALGNEGVHQIQEALAMPRANAANEVETAEDPFQLPPQAWSAGTGRVYIWSKTLDLVKERPILGYGLDTLAYFFPQDDPEKNSNLNDYNTIVDKPHNMYIGILFGSGVIAFLAFIILISLHAWKHIPLFKKGIKSENQIILASLFTAWCAFVIQGLFNDSIIGSAVIFWVLFGISVSMLQQELRKEQ